MESNSYLHVVALGAQWLLTASCIVSFLNALYWLFGSRQAERQSSQAPLAFLNPFDEKLRTALVARYCLAIQVITGLMCIYFVRSGELSPPTSTLYFIYGVGITISLAILALAIWLIIQVVKLFSGIF